VSQVGLGSVYWERIGQKLSLVCLRTLLPLLNLRGKGVNIVVADDGLERTHVDIAPNYRAGKKLRTVKL